MSNMAIRIVRLWISAVPLVVAAVLGMPQPAYSVSIVDIAESTINNGPETRTEDFEDGVEPVDDSTFNIVGIGFPDGREVGGVLTLDTDDAVDLGGGLYAIGVGFNSPFFSPGTGGFLVGDFERNHGAVPNSFFGVVLSTVIEIDPRFAFAGIATDANGDVFAGIARGAPSSIAIGDFFDVLVTDVIGSNVTVRIDVGTDDTAVAVIDLGSGNVVNLAFGEAFDLRQDVLPGGDTLNAGGGFIALGLIGRVELAPGLNLVSVPFDPAVVTDLAAVLVELGGATAVAGLQRFDPATGLFEQCSYDVAGSPVGSACTIPPVSGEGWLVEMLAPASIDYDLDLPCPAFDLQSGFSALALPCVSETVLASDLLQALLRSGSANGSVLSFDTTTGRWQSTVYRDGVRAGAELPNDRNRAFFVGLEQGAALPPPVLQPEYDPLGAFTTCSWTYQWTAGPNTGQQFVIDSGDRQDVNYSKGTKTGTIMSIVEADDGSVIPVVTSNDGHTYRFLRFGDAYVSSDDAMTSPDDNWTFDFIYSGLRRDFGGFLCDVANPANCSPVTGSQTLFEIQDVSVNGTLYQDAIIWWALDAGIAYRAVTLPASLGLTPPSSAATNGDSITGVTVWGLGSGIVAEIGVDAATGTVPGAYELLNGPNCS